MTTRKHLTLHRGDGESRHHPERDDLFSGPCVVLTPEQQRRQERCLRRYVRIAHQPHYCDRCCSMIEPGEQYEARIMLYPARTQHRLITLKEHIDPKCPWPDPIDVYDEDEDDLDQQAASAS